jgi:hypothetical protein
MRHAANAPDRVNSIGDIDPSHPKRPSRRLVRNVAAPLLAVAVLATGCSNAPRSVVSASPLPTHSSYSQRPTTPEITPSPSYTSRATHTATPTRTETTQVSPRATASKVVHRQTITQGTDQNWASVQGSGVVFKGIEGTITVPDINCRKVHGASRILFWVGVGVESTTNNNAPATQNFILQAGTGANCKGQDAQPQYFAWAQEYVPGSQYEQIPRQELSVDPADQILIRITAENGVAKFVLQNLTTGSEPVNPFAGNSIRYPDQTPLDVADITTENTLLADGSRAQTAYWTNPLRTPTFSDLALLAANGSVLSLSQVPDLEEISMINNGTGQTVVDEFLLGSTSILATRFLN